MAPPSRLTLVSPLRVWLIFNALFVALVASSWYTLYRQAQADNQRLVASQTITLTKSRFDDIKNRRFRDFVEGVGREFSDLHVRLNIADETYQFGKPPLPGHCSDLTYPLGGGGVAKITMCRPFRFSTAPILTVLLVYLLISGMSLVFVRRLERRTTAALVEFLRDSGVEIDSGRDLIGIMADMRDIRVRLDVAQAQERQLVDTRARAELAEQVAHDIRSPLTALEATAGDMASLPEKKRLQIRGALARIRDIANGLLDQRRASLTEPSKSDSPFQLSSLIDSIISEKRLALDARQNIDIKSSSDADSYGLFARVQPVELTRVLSNLINNAVEALGEHSGTVQVSVSGSDGKILLVIKDTGKGIPPEIMEKLGQRGASYGKTGGSGLGLHHARAQVDAWGGSLKIASEIGKGTTVTLELPSAPAPIWFVPEIALTPGGSVVILDDDEGIHQVWRARLDAIGADGHSIVIRDLFKPMDIREWVKNNASEASRALYLLDHDLAGFPETGLSLASELGLEQRAILVTGRYDDPNVMEECRQHGIRMLPKELALQVPIRLADAAPPLAAQAARCRSDRRRSPHENDMGERGFRFSEGSSHVFLSDRFSTCSGRYRPANAGLHGREFVGRDGRGDGVIEDLFSRIRRNIPRVGTSTGKIFRSQISPGGGRQGAAVERMKRSALYHYVPDELVGETLYPLTRLADLHPRVAAEHALKYSGREHLMQVRLPILDCLWNDVLHLAPLFNVSLNGTLCC
ncbi:MAG: HAMP domain-containing histidine kinase [Elusimicrobiota bacterium]|nr:MAG: HAMP domain-containing histidine kinase [Elusimicrobiota bacterium]